jgi:hypothetical protein
MATYNFYHGWKFSIPNKGGQGMFKLGDRWKYDENRFNILVGDMDFTRDHDTRAISSHPDHETMDNLVLDYEVNPIFGAYFTSSHWRNPRSSYRAPLDLNYAYDDASVRRFDDVVYVPAPNLREDERFTRIANVFDVDDNARANVPRP